MAEEKKEDEVGGALDAMGDALIDAVGGLGGALNDAAAKVVDVAGDVVDNVSDFIDDATENGPLKEFGDRVGAAGRDAADRMEAKADAMEDDENPASV